MNKPQAPTLDQGKSTAPPPALIVGVVVPVALPPAKVALPPAKATRPRYALRVQTGTVAGQFVARDPSRASYLLTPDLDRAEEWESPEAILRWLKGFPDAALDRLRGVNLYPVEIETRAVRIVGSWQVGDAGTGGAA